MAKEEIEDEIEYEEYAEYLEDKTEKDKNGQVKFKSVDNHRRALANGVETDEEIAIYMNYALEYFGHRCALSGERLVAFDEPAQREKNNKITTNLSAEHIVALTLGGNDIIPNVVPSVLQYNIQKNGYYILDWWPKAKDIEEKSIYNEERLLKLVNYMLKSLQIRKDLGIKEKQREYEKRLLMPNAIDEYLAKEEVAKKLLSDVITATEEDIDGKKILTKIPKQEGSIPSLTEQKENEIKITEEMFLVDAIKVLEKGKNIPQEIINALKGLYKDVRGEISFEIEVRDNILKVLEERGIEENKYTVANTLLVNTKLLKHARESNEEISNIIKKYLEKQIEELKAVLPEEQIKMVISNIPEALYEETARKRIIFWKEERGGNLEELIQRKANMVDDMIDALIILKNHGIDITGVPQGSKELKVWLAENNLTDTEITEILNEIKEKGITNFNFGQRQANIKKFISKDKYREYLENAKDENGNVVFTEEEIAVLTKKKNLSKDVVNLLIILKKHGIDITNIPQFSKQLKAWLKQVGLEDEKVNKIIDEAKAKGITNFNIGQMQAGAKCRNKDNYIESLEEAKDENGKNIFTEEEIAILTKTQDSTKDLVDLLVILKNHNIDLTNIPLFNKQLKTWLKQCKLEDEEINQIIDEAKKKGITNLNIGQMQHDQKTKYFTNYKEYISKAKDENGKNIFTEEEIKALTARQISKNQTQSLVDILVILKQYGETNKNCYIDITKIPNRNMDLQEWLDKNKELFNLSDDNIIEIVNKISEKGITTLNIGGMQQEQKSRHITEYKECLLKVKDKEGNPFFTEKEVDDLTSKRNSQKKIKTVIQQNKGNLDVALESGEKLEEEMKIAERNTERSTNEGR